MDATAAFERISQRTWSVANEEVQLPLLYTLL